MNEGKISPDLEQLHDRLLNMYREMDDVVPALEYAKLLGLDKHTLLKSLAYTGVGFSVAILEGRTAKARALIVTALKGIEIMEVQDEVQ